MITQATEVLFEGLSINSQNKLKKFSEKATEYFKGSKIYILSVDSIEVEKVERLLAISGYFMTRELSGTSDFTLKISIEEQI